MQALIDDEAGLDSEEDKDFEDSSEEEEEDDDAALKREGEGFLADEDEDEGVEDDAEGAGSGDDGPSSSRKKKRRKRSRSDHLDGLDEDDLALLEENTGKQFRRKKRLFKRQQEAAPLRGRDEMAREFGGDDLDGVEDLIDQVGPVDDVPLNGEGYDEDEEDEMEGFIEHDGERGDQVRANRRALAQKARAAGMSVEAYEELLEMLGTDAQTTEILATWENQLVDDAPALDEEFLEEEERLDPEAGRGPQKVHDPTLLAQYQITERDEEIRLADKPERLFILHEKLPEGLAIQSFNDLAEHVYNAIFAPHAPETVIKWLVQDGILEVEGVKETDVEELRLRFEGFHDLGNWAATGEDGKAVLTQGIQGFRLLRRKRAFHEENAAVAMEGELPSWTTIEEWREDEGEQAALKEAIQRFLQFVFARDLDVPFVAMFRKEALGELLATRSGEVPELVSLEESQWYSRSGESHVVPGAVLPRGRRIRRWDVLYAVFNEAVRYLQVQHQKDARAKQLDAAKLEDGTKAELRCELIAAATAQELEDWKANFDTLVAATVPNLDNLSLEDQPGDAAAAYTAPRRVKRYARLAGDRYPELAARLAMSAEDFASNIETIAHDASGNTMGMLAHPPPAADDPHAIVQEFMDDQGLYPNEHALEALATSRIQTGLNNAMHCLVEELASCPKVRRTVRRLYSQHATISTVPTEAGENELTPFTPLGRVKRLVNKPILDLMNFADFKDHYLRIRAAERQGFLKVTIHIPPTLEQWELDFAKEKKTPPPLTLQQAILDPFLRLYTGEAAEDPRPIYQFRASVIQQALQDHLLKHAHSALLRDLERVARSAVLDAVGDAFWIEATTPPLRLIDENLSQDPDDSKFAPPKLLHDQRICAVVHGMLHDRNLQDATHMVMLDQRGYVADHLLLPQLSGAIRKNPTTLDSMFEVPHKRSDVEKVVKFLTHHWPHVIVIGASNMHCQQLMDDIISICEKDIAQADKTESLYPNTNFAVRLEKEDVASLYEVSAFAAKDLKDYTPRVRQAVALGRHCMEPLAVLCALAEPHFELLALNLHPLQAEVPEADRQRVLDELLCTAVAQTGANPNAAAQMDWMAPMLAYVPGLGPRKAAQVVRAIKAYPDEEDGFGMINAQTIISRQMLLLTDDQLEDEDYKMQLRVLPMTVYKNAAPFLRLFNPSDDDAMWKERAEATKERLRYQPADEDVLREIAAAAFDQPADQGGSNDVIFQAVKAPHMVLQVDMSRFDEMWQLQTGKTQSKLTTFLDLAFELIAPFQDGRALERRDFNIEETFFELSKETPETMQPGRVLSATARYVAQNFARLQTDNGIECSLERRDASRNPPESLEGVLSPGQSLQVRVMFCGLDPEVNAYRISVSSRTDDRETDNAHWEAQYIGQYDPYYRVLTEEDRRRMEVKRLSMIARKQFIARPIQHARFANITVTKSAEVLTQPDFGGEERFKLVFREDGPRDGDAIFHPSMKGPDRLQLSVRLFCKSEPEGLNQPVIEHLDVMESKKKASDHLTLGSPLMLHHQFRFLSKADCEFEDLDELLQRFVEPYVMNFRRVLGHRKFVAGPPDVVDANLMGAFKHNPDWRLGLCRGDGGSGGIGYGYIAYMLRPSTPPGHFYFLISHRGFYLSLKPEPSKNHSSIEKVETAFKNHMKTMLAGRYSRQHRPATQNGPGGYASGPPGFGGGGGDGGYNGQRGYGGGGHSRGYAPSTHQNGYDRGYGYNGTHGGGAQYAPPAGYR